MPLPKLAPLLALLFCSTLLAELPPGAADQWQEKVAKARRDLDNADFTGVLRKTGKIQAEMQRTELGEEARLRGLAAQTFLLRALARQATGLEREAVFDLRAARQIDKSLEDANLAAFGEPGTALAAAAKREEEELRLSLARGRGVEPPRQLKPIFSDALHRLEGSVPEGLEVKVVIDAEGRPRQPDLPDFGAPLHPVVAIAVLNAIQEARYQPATLEGKKVAVSYLIFMKP